MLISCKESRIENNRSFYGCFYLGPFSNSQSLTVANALRRSLLSEIKGLAIVSVQIENVNNEYSTLPGVKDSVLDILLNLKEIVLKKKALEVGVAKGRLGPFAELDPPPPSEAREGGAEARRGGAFGRAGRQAPSAAKGEEEAGRAPAQSLGHLASRPFGMRERGLLLGKSSVAAGLRPKAGPVGQQPLPLSTFYKPILGYLKVKGPGVIRAKDLRLPPFIQCVDPSQYIATLADDGVLNVVFVIMEGKSYIIQKSPKNHSLVDATGACRVIQQRQVLVNRLKERIYTSLKGNEARGAAFIKRRQGAAGGWGAAFIKGAPQPRLYKGWGAAFIKGAPQPRLYKGRPTDDKKINKAEGKKSEKGIKLPPSRRDKGGLYKGFARGAAHSVSLWMGLGKESLPGPLYNPVSGLSVKKRKKAGGPFYFYKGPNLRSSRVVTSPLGKETPVDGNSFFIYLFPSGGNKQGQAGASPRQLLNKKIGVQGTVGQPGRQSLSSFSSCLHLDAVFSPITKVNYVVLENEHYIIEKYNEKNNAISSLSSFFSSLSFYPLINKRLSASRYKGSGKRSVGNDPLSSGPDFPLLFGGLQRPPGSMAAGGRGVAGRAPAPNKGPRPHEERGSSWGAAGRAVGEAKGPPAPLQGAAAPSRRQGTTAGSPPGPTQFSSFNKEDVFSFVDSLETTELLDFSSSINQRRKEKEQGNIVLEIWTNGSLHPRDALSLALKNLSLTFSTLQKLKIIHPIFKESTSYKIEKRGLYKG